MIGAVHGGVLCACFSWAGCIEAQDRDTAFFSEGRTQTTILDDIGDRGERKAFLKMYKEHNAAARWSLAVKFPAWTTTNALSRWAIDPFDCFPKNLSC